MIGTSKILKLQQSTDLNRQHQTNIDLTYHKLARSEEALTIMNGHITSIRELAIQANNDTLSRNDRQIIATEMSEHLQQMISVANTKEHGEYIFAGFNSSIEPVANIGSEGYKYLGNSDNILSYVGTNKDVITNI